MKLSFHTFCLFLGFVALHATNALACVSNSSDHAAEFHQVATQESCCANEVAKGACSISSKPGDANCPCDAGESGCHCPGCGMMCHGGGAFAVDFLESPVIESLQNTSVQKQAFYFAQHMPEDVYLPIWQPPKIRV